MKIWYFKFRFKDWMASPSVRTLTLAQEAIYLRLISTHYDMGDLPSDEEELRMLVGKECSIDDIRKVKRLFNERSTTVQTSVGDPLEDRCNADPTTKTRLFRPEVEDEIKIMEQEQNQRSNAGKRSAEKRKLNARSTTVQTSVETTDATSVQRPLKESFNELLVTSHSNKEGSNNIGGPSHVEVKGNPPPQSAPEIEPPPGFPRSEDEAIAAAEMSMVDRETAVREYHQAVSRGFVDGKGLPIRNWRSYVKAASCFYTDRNARQERNGRNGFHRETIGTSTPANADF